MNFKLESVTAFVSVDPKDGDEGIIGVPLGGQMMPAIAADEKRLMQLYPIINEFCTMTGTEYRIIRLSTRTDVTEEFKSQLENSEA